MNPIEPSITLDVQTACDFATALRSANRLDDAEAVYKHVVEIVPTHAEAMFQLGAIAEAKYDLERACQYYLKATSLVSEHALYRQRALETCVEWGWRQSFFDFRFDAPLQPTRPSTKERCWQFVKEQFAANGLKLDDHLGIAKRGPSDDLLKQTLAVVGRMINREKRFTEAEHVCSAILEVMPNNGDAWYQLGLIALSNGDFITAGARFRRARMLAGDNLQHHDSVEDSPIQKVA